MYIQNEYSRYKHIEISQVDAFAEWEASDSDTAELEEVAAKSRSHALPQYPSLDELEMEDDKSSRISMKKLFQRSSGRSPAVSTQSTHHSSQASTKQGGAASGQADASSLRSPSLDSSDQDDTGAQAFSRIQNQGLSSGSGYQDCSALKTMIQALGDPLDSRRQMFTPSTPYVHKFRTEMCKNFELHGKCKYGDECSFAHGKQQIMLKSYVSALYKTKQCKKYLANGYCPYGMRCQFIHGSKHSLGSAGGNLAMPSSQYQRRISDHHFEGLSDSLIETPEQKQQNSWNEDHHSSAAIVPKYVDILGHCLNISLQEHQKKLCVYTKKQNRKVGTNGISAPEYQYINIYQTQATRLSCFAKVTENASIGSENQETYYHGDASTYEEYLDHLTRQKKSAMPAQPVYFENGYMSDPSPYYEQPTDPISSIFYSINARKAIKEQQQYQKAQQVIQVANQNSNLKAESQTFVPNFQDLPSLKQLSGNLPGKNSLKLNSSLFKPSFIPKIKN